MRLSKEYYGHKENFCVGCYCLSSPFFMCIHNPLPWIFKTFLVYNWMLIVLKTTIHTLLTLIVLKTWGASSLILILWPLTKTYVVYNHEFGHMKIFYQIENLKFEQFYKDYYLRKCHLGGYQDENQYDVPIFLFTGPVIFGGQRQ